MTAKMARILAAGICARRSLILRDFASFIFGHTATAAVGLFLLCGLLACSPHVYNRTIFPPKVAGFMLISNQLATSALTDARRRRSSLHAGAARLALGERVRAAQLRRAAAHEATRRDGDRGGEKSLDAPLSERPRHEDPTDRRAGRPTRQRVSVRRRTRRPRQTRPAAPRPASARHQEGSDRLWARRRTQKLG